MCCVSCIEGFKTNEELVGGEGTGAGEDLKDWVRSSQRIVPENESKVRSELETRVRARVS
jgi:hypothetical protein